MKDHRIASLVRRAVRLSLFTCFAAVPLAHAQTGIADPAFPVNIHSNVFCAAVQPDGKVIVGGSFTNIAGVTRNRIARLNSDGTLDAGFNPNASGDVNAIAVQGDGKILLGGAFTNVVGSTRLRIARVNADGTLDTSFNPAASNVVNNITLQPDGKILVGGAFTNIAAGLRYRLARLNANGTLDTNFNPSFSNTVYGVALQLDGKIVVGGDFTNVTATTRYFCARLNADGTLDSTFTPNPSNSVFNAIVQADGKIIIGGNFTNVAGTARNRIARLNANGTLDTTFNPNASNVVNSVVVQTDGKIIIGGSFTNVGGATVRNRIARLNSDGTLDGTFDPNSSGMVNGIAMQDDGAVLVGGAFTNIGGAARTNLVRLLNDGVTQSFTVPGASRIEWLRGGASPEAQVVTFDFSTDGGTTWIPLGPGARVANGWEIAGLTLPASGIARGRAQIRGGIYNGSSGLTDTNTAFSGFTSSAPLVATGLASNVTDVTATLTAAVNPASSTTIAHFEYGNTTNYGSVGAIALAPNNGATTQAVAVAISGLTPGTNYHFRVVASNSVGTTFGADQTFSTPLLPDIAVEHPAGTNLADGAMVSFGASLVGFTNTAKTFIITNAGLTNMTGIVITKDGAHSNDFTMNTNGLSASLAPGESTTFTLTFAASATGFRTGAVHIASSDPDENPFDIPLLGSGYQPGTVDTNVILGANSTVHAMAVQPDGKTIITGFFTSAGGVARSRIARLNADGTLDSGFNPNANGDIYSVAVLDDAKILVGGTFSTIAGASRSRLARLNADGTIDNTFNVSVTGFTIYDIVVQPEGTILLAGDFTAIGGTTRNRVAQLLPDGTLTPFHPNANNTVNSLALERDGRIIIGGLFTSIGGTARANLARLNPDGTLSTAFTPTVNSTVYSVSAQLDGRIFIGGVFNLVNGVSRPSFARLNPDGSLDTTFNPAPNGTVYNFSQQANGKWIIAGQFGTIAGTARNGVARFNPDNTLDALFNPNVTSSTLVYGSAIQADGPVVLGGSFTVVGGLPRTNVARVFNEFPSQTLAATSQNRIDWLRGGATPEAQSVTFDFSTDGGSSWVALRPGLRLTNGWELTGFILPPSGLIRGRARVESGGYNGSSGLVESRAPFSGFPGQAPSVTTGISPSRTDVTATVGGSVNAAGSATTAWFEYGTTTSYGSMTNATLNQPNGAFAQFVSAVIRGLTPGTTYHFRLVASNSFGITIGDDQTFTTEMYPDIAVMELGGTNFIDGASTNNFGASLVGFTNAPRTFVISNVGLVNLTGLVITKDGAQSNDFILDTNSMSTTVAPGASTMFTVTFASGSTGTRTAAIHLANNDPDENPFDFSLIGSGYRPGDLDTNYNPNSAGTVYTTMLQPDGKLVVGGNFTSISTPARAYLAKLNTDGTVDPTFTNANFTVYSTVTQPDGKVLIAGDFTSVAGITRNRIARLNANGTLDLTFSNSVPSTIYGIALLADGKVMISGSFLTVGSVSRNRSARLNSDASLDLSYTNFINGTIYTMLPVADGKLLIGGDFTTVNGAPRSYIARLNPNGSLDTTFTNTVNNTVYCMAMQPDGKLLVGGGISAANGVTRNRLARFNPDGTVDSLDLGANSPVYTIALQTDGKILVGGNFFNVNGTVVRNFIARLNADGTLDAQFNPNASTDVDTIAIQPDGRIVIGGAFTTVGGLARNRIARLMNDFATQSLTIESNRVEWLRGGASPEAVNVTVDFSTDGGTNWTALGAATRISGGWEMMNLSLPPAGLLRARARTVGGYYNASAGFIETNAAFSGFAASPPVVTTLDASNVNVVAATLNARVNPSGSPSTAYFEYGTTTSYGSTVPITLSPANGASAQTVSANVSGLTGGTTYHYRVVASNSLGVARGDDVAFTTLVQPEIGVEQPIGTNLVDGVSSVAFGNALVGNPTAPRTFTIRNLGVADLTITNITKDGAHAADFTLDTNGMSMTVAPGDSTTFSVVFNPTGTNLRTAAIHIANNDADESPFDITLTGTATKAGDLDPTFNPNASDYVRSVVQQPDGKLAVIGAFSSIGGAPRTNIARLNLDGTADTSFLLPVNGSVDAITVLPDRKFLLGGFFTSVGGQPRNRIARVETNGVVDSFNPGAESYVQAMIPQPDGKVIVCGNFTNILGQIRNRIARLNADGTLDASFNPDASARVISALPMPDGKILVWGDFMSIGGAARNRFARLNSDGTADSSFNPAPDLSVGAAALQADGKVIVGGGFLNIGGVARTRIARLDPNGSVDTNFVASASEYVNSIAVQADGKILIAGDFTSVSGASRLYIARLNTNGTADTVFTPFTQNFGVSGVMLQGDGRVVINGSFTLSGGVTRNRISRFINDATSQTLTVPNANRIEWLRGGTLPEAYCVTFDVSVDGGASWIPLGSGTRIAGGWELTGIALPPSGQVRAQARIAAGVANTATYFLEFVMPFSGLPAPELVVMQPAGTELADGENRSFGSVLLGTSNSMTFVISNVGTANLSGIAITKDGANAADFTLDTNSTSAVLAAGESTTFSVTFAPGALGPRAAAIHIANNDVDESLFDVLLSGTGVAPEISIEHPAGTTLTNGTAAINFGSLTVGANSAAKTFIITNTGAATLNQVSVTLDGVNASDFTLDAAGTATSLAAGASTTFSVVFTPSSAGVRNAAVHVASDDADENPFDISLTGSGDNRAPVVANPIPDQSATGGAAFSYTFPVSTFSDPDSGQTLSYSATKNDNTPLPAWLAFDPATRTFSGTPPAGNFNTLALKVIATDNGTPALSVNDLFTITIYSAPVAAAFGATDVTPYAATLEGSVNPNGLATTAEFRFGEGNARVQTRPITLSPNNGTNAQNVSVAVSGLNPNTTYTFTVHATNSAGGVVSSVGSFTTETYSSGSWHPAGPGSDGRAIYGTWFANADEGWAVTVDGGSVRRTIDGGTTWADEFVGSDAIFYDVAGADAKNVWVVGGGGYIAKWNGSSWTPQTSGVGEHLFGLCVVDTNNAWAVGEAGRIVRWNGSSWSIQPSGATGTLHAVWGADANNVWAVGVGGTILKWNGGVWTVESSGTTQTFFGVNGTDAAHVWAVGANGTIRKGNGYIWTPVASGTSQTLHGVFAADANNAWAVGHNAVLRWNGESWTPQSTTLRYYWDVAGVGADRVWVVGEGGFIMRWDGGSWATQSHGTSADLLGMWGADINNIWAVGGYGETILKWNGASWNVEASPSVYRLWDVWGADVNNVWAVGEQGTIIKWNGSSWAVQPSGTTRTLYGIWGVDANNVWAVGEFNTILKWNGSSWSVHDSSPGVTLYAIHGFSANDIWAIGYSGTVRRWNGSTWSSQNVATTKDLRCIWGSSNSRIWVGGQDGARYLWNGSSWANQSTSQSDWVLGIWGSNPNNAWSGLTAGKVQRYNPLSALGAPWLAESYPVGAHVWSIWGLGPTTVFASGSRGTIRMNADFRPTVATSDATSVGSSSATLQGTINPNGRSVTATFQYGKTLGIYDKTAQAIVPQNGASSVQSINASVIGLAPSTTYYVRASGGSAFGRSYAGSISSFTTAPGPDIAVERPAGTALTDGASRVNVAAAIGSPVTKTFTIRNTGTLNLNGLGVFGDGADIESFSIGSLGATTLAPGGTTSLDVTFHPTSAGVKTAGLHITSDDPDENPFDIILVGTADSSEIAIQHPAGTFVNDGGSVAFDDVSIGAPATKTFTVTNSGLGLLTISSATLIGPDAGEFSVGAFSSTTIPPEGSATFTVTFSPATLGAKSASLQIANNDGDENPFDINFSGNATSPEIVVDHPPGTEFLANGIGFVNFGFVHMGRSATKTFTVRNTGVGDLRGMFFTKEPYTTGASINDFVIGPFTNSIPPGGSATFTATFTPSVFTSHAIWLHLFNSDADENPFDILLYGTGIQPEIAVEQPAGTDLVDNAGTIDYGTVTLGAPVTKTFTVKSIGATALTGMYLYTDGANPNQFQFSYLTPFLGAGENTNFTVTFNPTSAGTKSATLHLVNNDEDEWVFDIALTGTVIAPEIVVEQPSGVDVTNRAMRTMGSVMVGSASQLEFTIRNTGVANLLGLGTTFTGANAADFSVTASPVAPLVSGDSTTFTVQFAPSSGGAKNATLRIANNDENENPFEIRLTGSGLANSPPAVTEVHTNIVVPVNTLATNSGTFGDMDGDSVVLSASIGTMVQGVGTWSWSYTPTALGSQLVTVLADDGHPGGTNSVTFTITAIDVTSPTAAFIPVTPDPRTNAVGIVTLNFSEGVSGVDASDFALTHNASPVSLAGMLVASNTPATYALDLTAFTSAPGDYVLTLVASGSGIADLSGNPLAADASDAFSVAAGVGSVSGGTLSVNNAPGGSSMGLTVRGVTIGGTNYLELHDANNALAAGEGAIQVDANTIRVPLSGITGELQINGGSGDDHFVIDARGGCVLPPGGASVNGGAQGLVGDSLQVLGAFANVEYDATSPGAGVVHTDCGDVSFTGLEPVDFTSAVVGDLLVNVDPFHVFAGAVTTTISANSGNTRVAFSGGLELIDFGVITNAVMISGDSADVDTIVLSSVETNLIGNLAINAQAADMIVMTNTSVVLAVGRTLDITAGTVMIGSVAVNGGVSVHGGTMDFALDGASSHSRLAVTGTVMLASSPTLSLTGSYVPQAGDTFTLIENDGTEAVIGNFAGLPEGSLIIVRGVTLHLSYAGGTGNDVMLSVAVPPTISCAENATYAVGAEWTFATPSVSANCGSVTLSIAGTTTNAMCGRTYTATRLWLATNTCGMTATCTQTVAVVDLNAPTFTCPSNINVACAAQIPPADFAGGAVFDDGDAAPTVIHVGDESVGSNPRFITRTYRATDACGNTTTCSQTITVHDTNAPQITCPSNIVAEATSASGAIVSFSAGAVDNCDASPTITHSPASGTSFPLGNTTVTTRAVDVGMNTNTCTFTVTVVDTTPPTLNVTGSQTVAATSSNGAVVTYPPATATDAVTASPLITYSHASGSTFAIGFTTVSVVAADEGGNSRTNTFTVNVTATPPELPLQTNRTIAELTLLSVTNTAADLESPATLGYELLEPPAGASIDTNGVITWTPSELHGPGTNTIVTVATDATGLRGTNSFEVVVTEMNVAPSLGALLDQIVNPGESVNLTASATDTDWPANVLSYSLVDAPAGANIDPITGAFTWRTRVNQHHTTNVIRIRVQDDASPSLSATNAFSVSINPLALVTLTSVAVSNQFVFRVSGTAGPDYIIMASEDLSAWSDIATNLAPVTPFEVEVPASAAKRFYKVRLAP